MLVYMFVYVCVCFRLCLFSLVLFFLCLFFLVHIYSFTLRVARRCPALRWRMFICASFFPSRAGLLVFLSLICPFFLLSVLLKFSCIVTSLERRMLICVCSECCFVLNVVVWCCFCSVFAYVLVCGLVVLALIIFLKLHKVVPNL